MSKKDLAKIWQTLSTFLVLVAAATWSVTQGISPDFGVELDQRREVAALLALAVCMPLYWLCLWFAGRYAATYGGALWQSRLPPVGLEDELDVTTPEARVYQRFIFSIFVVFPLLAITHFYRIFIATPIRELPGSEPVSMWSMVSPLMLTRDAYRYGEEGGVTFFPLYEPVILTGLFLGIWVSAAMFTWRLFRPHPVGE